MIAAVTSVLEVGLLVAAGCLGKVIDTIRRREQPPPITESVWSDPALLDVRRCGNGLALLIRDTDDAFWLSRDTVLELSAGLASWLFETEVAR